MEYDLDSSSISAGLHLAARTEVEQRCRIIYIYLNIYNLAIYGYTCNFMQVPAHLLSLAPAFSGTGGFPRHRQQGTDI